MNVIVVSTKNACPLVAGMSTVFVYRRGVPAPRLVTDVFPDDNNVWWFRVSDDPDARYSWDYYGPRQDRMAADYALTEAVVGD